MRVAMAAGLLLLAGCGDPATDKPAAAPDKPFRYHGQVLRLPARSVDTLVPEGVALGPWARLVPDARGVDEARYLLDLGRRHTGQDGPNGFGLGATFYPDDAPRTALGDGYTLRCNPPARREPAYDCAALLRTLPFAAIQFRERPSAAQARSLVAEAEAYLAKARS